MGSWFGSKGGCTCSIAPMMGMCACVCVCVCACMCVCIFVRVLFVCVWMDACMLASTPCSHTYIHTYIHKHVCVSALVK